MKILHICSLYHPSKGGAQIHMKELSENFASRGHDVMVFASKAYNCDDYFSRNNDSKNLLSEEIINGVKVKRFKINWLFARLFFRVLWKIRGGYWLTKKIFSKYIKIISHGPVCFQMINAIIKEQPQIILAINLHATTTFAAYMAHKRLKSKFIVMPLLHVFDEWVHDDFIYEILASCDSIIALTDFEKEYLVNKGLKAEKIAVIGPGVDIYPNERDNNEFNERQSGSSERDQSKVFFCGRIVRSKGIDTLIDAMQIVWKKHSEAELTIAGTVERDYFRELDDKIKSIDKKFQHLIKKNFEFQEEEKDQIYEDCDFLILPSITESFGIVILEAWKYKKPVIVCRNSAPATVVQEKQNGLHFAYKDAKNLSEKINYMIENKMEAKQMGENGFEEVLCRYTWDQVANRLIEIYKK